ncbi:hypothetical protein DESA109040_12975 [Deinococcus saxicola]|uniref:hypothetical protein n=1 Tax=Deinococcus saxicola TaxID=249406 RepID=UPI0039EF9016
MNHTTNEPGTTEKVPEKGSYVRLSALLKDIPANECGLIVEQWEEAILKGVLKSIPLTGEHFAKVVQLPTGEKKRRTIQDELVCADETCRKWIADQRQESRYQVLAHVGRVETTMDRLKAGKDSFEKLVEIRKRRLKVDKIKGES